MKLNCDQPQHNRGSQLNLWMSGLEDLCYRISMNYTSNAVEDATSAVEAATSSMSTASIAVDPDTVIIDNQKYSVHRDPKITSGLVKEEKKIFSCIMEMNSMMNYVEPAGNQIQVAYLSAIKNGYKEGMVENVVICDLGKEISEACHTSVSTVANFMAKSKIALQEVHGIYDALLDGFVEVAECLFQTLSEATVILAEETKELQTRLKNLQGKIQVFVEEFAKLQQEAEKDKCEAEGQQKELLSSKKFYEGKKKSLDESAADLATKMDTVQKSYEEKKKIYEDAGFWSQMKFSMFGTRRENTDSWKAERKRLEECKELNESQAEGVAVNAKSNTADINDCDSKIEKAKGVIEDLQVISKALKFIADIMMKVTTLLGNIKKRFEEIGRTGVKAVIERIGKCDKETQLNYWHSTGFKCKMVTYSAKWVALQSICSDYEENVTFRKTASLFEDMTRILSKEDAKRRYKNIMEEMGIEENQNFLNYSKGNNEDVADNEEQDSDTSS